MPKPPLSPVHGKLSSMTPGAKTVGDCYRGQCQEKQLEDTLPVNPLWMGHFAPHVIFIQPLPLNYQGLETPLQESAHLPKLAFTQLLLER